ncbi:MAG: TonB family protein [Nostoc sp. CreGUA01]|nr:energy transducer TonB [Nostoc sp. CreGUA01]
MSFSGITVEQRSKEVVALKSFLAYSLIGSLVLHIGVLSSGIANYLTRMPEENDQPIEVAIVDSPTAEPEKPVEEIPEQPKKEPEVVQKQPIETPPVQQIIEKPKIQPVQQEPQQTTQKPQPINREVAVKTVTPSANQGSQQLRDVLSGIRDSRATQGGGGSAVLTGGGDSGGSVAVGTGTGSGSGTGSGIGSGSGSGTGNEPVNRPVAAAPTVPTPPQINNNSGNGSGRAACREGGCRAKYPEAARRRGIEGRVEVAVDTDAQGNVTNVRIARSSGNRDLDQETLRQAREWKLKPTQGGRQGVSIATEFAIKGSRRHRQVQERNTQRQAQERTQQTAATNSTEGTSRRRRRDFTSSTNEATPTKPAQSGFSRPPVRQRVETTNTRSSQTRTTSSQGTARETLRRIRSQRTTTNSSQKPQASTNRRRRENPSQNKLRESLRRLRQPESQPTAPTQQ